MGIIRKTRKPIIWLLCGDRETEADPKGERTLKMPLGDYGFRVLRDFFQVTQLMLK